MQAGETLTGIARRYGISPDTLRAQNNIGDADFILVGQKLRIAVATAEPTPEATQATTVPVDVTEVAATPLPAAATPTETAIPTVPVSYTVQAGETLSGIAKRYGLALEDLKALNNIEDENAIAVDQVLVLIAADTGSNC